MGSLIEDRQSHVFSFKIYLGTKIIVIFALKLCNALSYGLCDGYSYKFFKQWLFGLL